MIHIKNLKKKKKERKTTRETNLRAVVLLTAFSKHPSSLCSGYNSDILLLTSSQGQFWVSPCFLRTSMTCSLILLIPSSVSESVQLLSHVQLFATPWTAACQVHHQLPEFTQTHVHWVGDAIQPSHPLSSPSPPAFLLDYYIFIRIRHCFVVGFTIFTPGNLYFSFPHKSHSISNIFLLIPQSFFSSPIFVCLQLVYFSPQ